MRIQRYFFADLHNRMDVCLKSELAFAERNSISSEPLFGE